MTRSTVTLTPNATPVLGAGAVAENHDQLHHEILRRVRRPDYPEWLAHVAPAAACSRPVRLQVEATWHGDTGTHIERVSDDMPDRMLYVACKNRRASVCPACAEIYRADTYQLVKAGLLGGKGVPDTVTEHPAFFVTLTAPSFGPVHTRTVGANGKPRPCRIRRHNTVCQHGRQVVCLRRHDADDPSLGEAICPDCYDYQQQAAWNLFSSGELWRRFTINLNRRLATVAKDRGVRVRVSYAKVAEYQRRGVVHFHALIRVDGYNPDDPNAVLPPDPGITRNLISSHIATAAQITRYTTPHHPRQPTGWNLKFGAETDIRTIHLAASDVDDRGTLTTTAVAAYLAKYATKATEETGHTSRPLTEQAIKYYYRDQNTHQARQLRACWTLGQIPFSCTTKHQHAVWAETWGRLQKWAHMLGYGGHFSTKSRRYSTTLTALRAVRKAYQQGQQPEQNHDPATQTVPNGTDDVVNVEWMFNGTGWLTIGDAALANTSAAKARERKQIAKHETEELIGS